MQSEAYVQKHVVMVHNIDSNRGSNATSHSPWNPERLQPRVNVKFEHANNSHLQALEMQLAEAHEKIKYLGHREMQLQNQVNHMHRLLNS